MAQLKNISSPLDCWMVRGNDARAIQDQLGGAGVSRLASDSSFDLQGGAPYTGLPEYPARSFGGIFVLAIFVRVNSADT